MWAKVCIFAGMKSNVLYSVAVAAVVAMCCGCAGKSGRGLQAGGGDDVRPVVTVSIPPLGWFVERIAGDSVEVNVLMSSGGNPETFEPTVSSMKQAAGSRLLLITGSLGFEHELARKIASGGDAPAVIDTSEGVEMLYGTHDGCGHPGHRHAAQEADPHTWTSVKNGRLIAQNIYEALVDADPSRAVYYLGRYEDLMLCLDSLDADFSARLAPRAGEAFLVMHPSLGYFARDYGLEQISIGQEGRESSIKSRRRQIDHAGQAGVELLFLQADFDSRQAATVAEGTATRIVTINPLNAEWDNELIRITDALTQ